jgi:hypothetical protein
MFDHFRRIFQVDHNTKSIHSPINPPFKFNPVLERNCSVTIHPMPAQFFFLACGLTFLGMIILTIAIINLRPALESHHWPTTTGEIIQVDSRHANDPASPAIRYRYFVSGKEFTGSRIRYGGEESALTNQMLALNASASAYTPGQTIEVHYHPTFPDRAVLQTGVGFSAYLPIGLGGLFIVLGLIFSLGIFIR